MANAPIDFSDLGAVEIPQPSGHDFSDLGAVEIKRPNFADLGAVEIDRASGLPITYPMPADAARGETIGPDTRSTFRNVREAAAEKLEPLTPKNRAFPMVTAEDVAKGNWAALLPGVDQETGQSTRSLNTPGYEAPTVAKVGAGLQRAAAGTAEALAPWTIAGGPIGLVSKVPLAGRAISAAFAADMINGLPDQAKAFIGAVQAGDVQTAVESGLGGTLGAFFSFKAMQHAVARSTRPKFDTLGNPVIDPSTGEQAYDTMGLAEESPAIRKLFTKRITEEFPPEKLRDVYLRANRGEATPAEEELVRWINQSFESPGKAVRRGVAVTKEEPRIESEFWRNYLGLKEGQTTLDLLGEKGPNASTTEFKQTGFRGQPQRANGQQQTLEGPSAGDSVSGAAREPTAPVAPEGAPTLKRTDMGLPYLDNVQVRQKDGAVITAEFNGYFEHPARGMVPSIGYPTAKGATHGPLRPGDTLLSPVPTPEEWDAIKAAPSSTGVTNPNPTAAQKEAGNFSKRQLKWSGLNISIENEAGSIRTGKDATGKPWQVQLPSAYGYVKGTEGKDKEHLDVYVGPNLSSGVVYVVDQIDPATGKFDEHKSMIGFPSGSAARAAYEGAFSDGSGPSRIGAVTAMPAEKFIDWTKGDTSKPLAYKQPKGGESNAGIQKGQKEEGQGDVLTKPGAVTVPPPANDLRTTLNIPVSAEKWAEMDNYNAYDQVKKWGYSKAMLIEQATTGHMPAPPTPPKGKAKKGGRSIRTRPITKPAPKAEPAPVVEAAKPPPQPIESLSTPAKPAVDDRLFEQLAMTVNQQAVQLGQEAPVRQANLGVLTGGKPVYHETSLASAYGVYNGLRKLMNRSWTRLMVSDNPDLALGQTGGGVLFELDPTRVNGWKHNKPGTTEQTGFEYWIDRTMHRAVRSITFANERQMEAFQKRFPKAFDYANAVQVERGFKIEPATKSPLPSTPAPKTYPNTGVGSPADEYGAIYGPTLNDEQRKRFAEQVGESFPLNAPEGTTAVLKVKPSMLWLETDRQVGRSVEHEVGVAYLKIRSDGTTVLDASKHGRPIDKLAADMLIDFLRKASPMKEATKTPPSQIAPVDMPDAVTIGTLPTQAEVTAANRPSLGTTVDQVLQSFQDYKPIQGEVVVARVSGQKPIIWTPEGLAEVTEAKTKSGTLSGYNLLSPQQVKEFRDDIARGIAQIEVQKTGGAMGEYKKTDAGPTVRVLHQATGNPLPPVGDAALTPEPLPQPLTEETAKPIVDAWRSENPNAPEVQIVNRPDWTQIGSDGRHYGVRGWWDGQKIITNLAYTTDETALRGVLDHEKMHPLLDSPEGLAAIDEAIRQELGGIELTALRDRYRQREGESNDDYRRRVYAEWFAHLKETARSMWKRIIDRIREFLAKFKIVNLADDEIGRAMMRTLERKPIDRMAGGDASLGDETPANPSGRPQDSRNIGQEAAGFLRARAGADQGVVEGAVRRGQEREALAKWAADNGALLTAAPESYGPLLDSRTSEHLVRITPDGKQVIKWTWPGSSGSKAVLKEGSVEREYASPLDYLTRVELQNRVFGDDIRVLGFQTFGDKELANKPGGLSIVTSQPFREGSISNPNPTRDEVWDYMDARGFVPDSEGIEMGAWRRKDGVLVMDARPDNFVKTPGGIFPIDLQMGYSEPATQPIRPPFPDSGDASLTDQPVEPPGGGEKVQIAGVEYDIAGKDKITRAQKQQADAAVATRMAQMGFPGVADVNPNGTVFIPRADGVLHDDAAAQLKAHIIDEVKKQFQPGGDPAYVSSLVNAVNRNFVAGNWNGVLSDNAIFDLIETTVAESSFRGQLLRAITGIHEDVESIGRNAPIYLRRIYAKAFGGEQIEQVVNQVLGEFKGQLTDKEIEHALDGAPEFKGILNRLTAGKPLEFLKRVFSLPFSQRKELRRNVERLAVETLGVSKADAKTLGKAFEQAFDRMFDRVAIHALNVVRQALSANDRKLLKVGSRRGAWAGIERAVKDGRFDAEYVLQRVAAFNGQNVPSEKEIAHVRETAEEIGRLRTVPTARATELAADPVGLARENVIQSAATAERRVKLKRDIETLWSKWTKPISMFGAGSVGRSNMVEAAYEFTAANLLFKAGFLTRQTLDVMTAAVAHIQFRALANVVVQHGGFTGASTQAFWKDADVVIRQAITTQLEALAPAMREFKEAMKGTAEVKNTDRLLSGIALFERVQLRADQLKAQGKVVEAGLTRMFGWMRFSYRFSSALDNLQGVPQEWQEIRTQAYRSFRENGMTPAEAQTEVQKIVPELRGQFVWALAQAKRILDATGRDYPPSELKNGAWHIVKGMAYQRMRELGMPADDFESRNRLMRSTNAWNESLSGVSSIGGVVATSLKAAGQVGKNFPPVALFTGAFGRFGNAIGTGIDRSLTWMGLGMFPSAFGVRAEYIDPQTGIASRGSPWYRTREDRAQRAIEGGVGSNFGLLFALAVLAGYIVVRSRWPRDPKERERWEANGWKPGTAAIQLGDGKEIVISTTVGPLGMIRPWLAGAGALHDALDRQHQRQAKMDAEAAKKGLPAGKAAGPSTADMMGVGLEALWGAAMGGRTAGGLIGSLTDYGTFNASKTAAATLSPFLPGLPGLQEVSRMAGVQLDQNATVLDFMLPLPTSPHAKVNVLGDPAGNPNDLQRIVQVLTGGTTPWLTDAEAGRMRDGYAALYSSGWMPPSIDPGKGQAFADGYRPMTADELEKYTVRRGELFKAELGALDNPTPAAVKAAFGRANTQALTDVGVMQTVRASAANRPATTFRAGSRMASRAPMARVGRSGRSGRSFRSRSGLNRRGAVKLRGRSTRRRGWGIKGLA